MMRDYPATPAQQQTALRRGWTHSKLTGWQKPKRFSQHDEARIEAADERRRRRGIGAD